MIDDSRVESCGYELLEYPTPQCYLFNVCSNTNLNTVCDDDRCLDPTLLDWSSWATHPNMFLLVELTRADRDVCTACGLTFSSTCCSSRGSSSIFLIRDYNA